MTTVREFVGGTGRREHFDGGFTVPPLPHRRNTVISLELFTILGPVRSGPSHGRSEAHDTQLLHGFSFTNYIYSTNISVGGFRFFLSRSHRPTAPGP